MQYNSRTYNSIRNIFFSIGNQVITLFLNFFSRAIFIKILGTEYLGINGLFSDILMMLSLADLGLGSAMVYSFYKPLSEKDESKLCGLINYYKKIYNYIALSVAIIGLIIVPFIDEIVNIDKFIPNLRLYYVLFLLNSVASYLFVYRSSIITADQKGYIISIYSTIVNMARIIIQILFLILTKNYIGYLIIQILSTILNNLFIAYKSKKIYPYLDNNYEIDEKEKKSIFENIRSVFIYKVSSVLLNGTDNILISSLVGTIWVGYYSNYNMIIGTINKFITTAFTSLNSSVGNLIIEESNIKRYNIFKTLQMISFIIAGVSVVCIYILINDFITLWVGETFVLNKLTLISILLNFYIASVLPPIWTYREATGLFKKTKYLMLITALVNLILSVLLGKIYGIGGIIMASALAKLTTYFWYEPILIFKIYFKSSPVNYFIDHLINLLVVILVSVFTSKLTKMIVVNDWIDFTIKSVICVLISITAYTILNIKKSEFRVLLSKCSRIAIGGE